MHRSKTAVLLLTVALVLIIACLALYGTLLWRMGEQLTALKGTPPDDLSSFDQPHPPSSQTVVSIFSWEEAPYQLPTRAPFYTVLENLQITQVFQSFADESLYTSDTLSFLEQSHTMGREVFYLTGVAEWGLETDGASMLRQVEKVAAFNKAIGLGTGFAGIVFDVEPYLTTEWDSPDRDAVMRTYADAVKAVYAAAHSKGLTVVLCVPVWYDRSYGEVLEELVAEGCDILAVMNYNRPDQQSNIAAEVALARKYDKEIQCIFEFQAAGVHQLTEEDTYAQDGLQAAQEDFRVLYEEFGYDKLGFSYHYYKPVAELYLGK